MELSTVILGGYLTKIIEHVECKVTHESNYVVFEHVFRSIIKQHYDPIWYVELA